MVLFWTHKEQTSLSTISKKGLPPSQARKNACFFEEKLVMLEVMISCKTWKN